MNETGGRHELKFFINHADFIQLRARLPFVACTDENALDETGYRVRSLYFDNYSDKALRQKIDGVNEREKFRLRLYNDDTDFIRIEKKSKANGLCFKQSAMITPEVCERLLLGAYEPLKESGDPLCWELYTKLHSELIRPKNIVDYKREAYVFPAGNVRITIDHDIRATADTSQFLYPRIIAIPIPETMILEVKYDHFLPELVRGMVALSSRQSAAFSKYAATRT